MYQFAGHDTTSHTLAWTIYCVATHPDVEEKLTKELDAVFGPPTKGGPCADVTYDSLAKCEYLAAVLRESMRLYPVASDGAFAVLTTQRLFGLAVAAATPAAADVSAVAPAAGRLRLSPQLL